MNETKFADSSEEESLGRFAQYIDYPKEMPFPNMRFECGGPGWFHRRFMYGPRSNLNCNTLIW